MPGQTQKATVQRRKCEVRGTPGMLQGNRDADGNETKFGDAKYRRAPDGGLHMKRSFFPHELFSKEI